MRARTEDTTENAPLIPQYHAIGASVCLLATLMPMGNSMPIRNPAGESTTADTSIRAAADDAS